MLNLGEGFGDVKPIDGGFPEFECKGYPVVLKKLVQTTSKKTGKQMMRFEIDISDGPKKGFWGKGKYPQCINQVYVDEKGLARLKGIFMVFIKDNLSMFPEVETIEEEVDGEMIIQYNTSALFASGNFDEQRLVGLEVGVITRWDQTGRYVNPDYFVTKAEAEAAPAIPKPKNVKTEESKPAISNKPDSQGNFF